MVNNDVPPREDAYLHSAVDVPREGAIVQRADVTPATDFLHITTSVSEKGYMQQMDAGQQAEADDCQPIQSNEFSTDDIVELKEDLPETLYYRDDGSNVDREKSNRPEDVPSEVKDLLVARTL